MCTFQSYSFNIVKIDIDSNCRNRFCRVQKTKPRHAPATAMNELVVHAGFEMIIYLMHE